jgi:tetratricopeptide (TPR) repeat protein
VKAGHGERWAVGAAVAIAFGAYARTCGYQFVYDDAHVIQNRELLHSLANWRAIITSTWWEYALYRPLTQLSFAWDWWLSGGDPRVFHLVNVLIHAAVTALVYLLARGGLGPVGAGATAILFAVHPVHVEGVANVVGRAELLAALFVLLAALAYRTDGELAARGNHSWRRAAASLGTLLAMGLGLASKETAFATPGLLLLVDWWEGQRTGEPARKRFQRHRVLWAAAVALSLQWLWIRATVLGELAGDHPAAGVEGESLEGRLWVMAPVVLQYVRLLLFPARLSADYSPDFLPAVSGPTLVGVVGLMVLSGAAALAVRARRRAPAIAVGLAWVGGTLLVVSNVILPTGVVLAERTLYLPSVGAVILLGWVVAWAEASWRGVGVGLTALAVGLGMVRTITRERTWSDNSHFFPQLVRDAPGSYRSYWVAAALSFDSGDPAGGEALLRRALLIYPLQPQIWETWGYQLEKQQRWRQAARAFQAAYSLDSLRLESAGEGIVAYVRAGMADSAAAFAARVRKSAYDDFHYQAAVAALDSTRGRFLASMTWRRRVAWQFPTDWRVWYLTADAAVEARYCWEARRSLARMQQLRASPKALSDIERRLKQAGCGR